MVNLQQSTEVNTIRVAPSNEAIEKLSADFLKVLDSDAGAQIVRSLKKKILDEEKRLKDIEKNSVAGRVRRQKKRLRLFGDFCAAIALKLVEKGFSMAASAVEQRSALYWAFSAIAIFCDVLSVMWILVLLVFNRET